MELSRILIRELNDYQLIELREMNGQSADAEPAPGTPAPATPSAAGPLPGDADEAHGRSFPIVIGLPEAQAIERRLKGISIKRPQTHDLLANVIKELGGELVSITITDLAEHTFFATLDVRKEDGTLLHIDSRPSDAIALGVANDVPIYVAEHVLESAAREEE